MTNYLDLCKDYLENAMSYYYNDDIFIKYYNRVPKTRYHTFKYCFDYFKDKNPIIVELGTTRSYLDGKFEGCCNDNPIYWEPNNIEKWDWSAGCFTKVFANLFPNSNLHTIDIMEKHLRISKTMNNDRNNIIYHHTSSENFLNTFDKKIDLLYLDTGDMDEKTAQLHLREAKIIVEKNILKDDGLLLIDDVKNPMNEFSQQNLGKSKYSIPYLLNNGFSYVVDEYQVILKKNNI